MARVIIETDDGQVLGEYPVTTSDVADGETWNLRRSFARKTLAQAIRKLVETGEQEEQLADVNWHW